MHATRIDGRTKAWRLQGLDTRNDECAPVGSPMVEEDFMRRAIEIAENGRGKVQPNPLVGCVLVRDGEVIAEGWHDNIGGFHAEQAAIADAEERGIATSGSTAYVTLEPCNHHGRTPPCTEALLWAGIDRVVIGALDPNPTVRGGGMSALMDQGVKVENGLLERECKAQMREFIHWCEFRKPFVTLKAAIDIQGRVDVSPEEPSERFTSISSLKRSHLLRSNNMGILVGVETVIRDNPDLSARDVGAKLQPIRIVIDPNGRIPKDCTLLSDGRSRTLIIHSRDVVAVDPPHVERYVIPSDGQDIEVNRILQLLGDLGIQSLIIEGGPTTWKSFIESDAVDAAILIQSPKDLQSGEIGMFGEESLRDTGLVISSHEMLEGDKVTYWSRSQ